MKKSLKREQIELLRFEKQLLGLGAGLSALTAGAAASAADKVGQIAPAQAEQVQQAYLNLVETVQAAHDKVESAAVQTGAEFMVRGVPKERTLLEIARSLLGTG